MAAGGRAGAAARPDAAYRGADNDRRRRSGSTVPPYHLQIALAPGVILVNGSPTLAPLLQPTRNAPIVFVIVADPVGAGFVDSLARPGGNATGFTTYHYSISAKWLELLEGIAPSVKRIGVLRDPALTLGTAQYAVIQSMAPTVGVEVTAIGVHDTGEIERAASDGPPGRVNRTSVDPPIPDEITALLA